MGWLYLVFGAGIAVLLYVQNARHAPAGPDTSVLRCPHCGATGCVKASRVARKRGVSGGKATAGFLTGGLSLWLVGLSRRQVMTAMSCSRCRMTWDVY